MFTWLIGQYVPMIVAQIGHERDAQVHQDVVVEVKRGFGLRHRGMVAVAPVTLNPEYDDVVHKDVVRVRVFEDLQAGYQSHNNDKPNHGKEHPGVGGIRFRFESSI